MRIDMATLRYQSTSSMVDLRTYGVSKGETEYTEVHRIYRDA